MNPIVETNYGKVEGEVTGNLIQWLGVPFAKPPIDELRFKRAQECDKWEGIKSCRSFKRKPIQFIDFILTKIPESEDCLHLNIIRSNNNQQKLPVFVWIYGGNFIFGENSDSHYDGSLFAQDGVLFVSINYRLGALGYFDFSIYDNQNFDSNGGFSDQVMALKWIKENIEYFGGDPDNITLAGESAGAISISHLMVAPSTQNLFQKAILQSCLPEM
ncbi:MAG: carboxylesterase family protein, partial [Neisseriaceae bacterium]|nr:carboxylesterase family protein [Neisseriaceae bacterium]